MTPAGPGHGSFKIPMPRDFFPWVVASGCLEKSPKPYLHEPTCGKTCMRKCNPSGGMQGLLVLRWLDNQKLRWSKRRRFLFGSEN